MVHKQNCRLKGTCCGGLYKVRGQVKLVWCPRYLSGGGASSTVAIHRVNPDWICRSFPGARACTYPSAELLTINSHLRVRRLQFGVSMAVSIFQHSPSRWYSGGSAASGWHTYCWQNHQSAQWTALCCVEMLCCQPGWIFGFSCGWGWHAAE